MAIGDIVKKQSFYTPDKVAMIIDDREHTFRELNERTNRVGNFLIGKGIRKGDRISVLLLNCIEFMDVYFAAAKIGAIFVPLNYRLAPAELEYQLNDCGSRLLVFHDEFAGAVQSISPRLPVEKDKYVAVGVNIPDWAVDYNDIIGGYSPAEPDPEEPVEWEDPQAIMYTSGVTGNPKGALLPHRKTLFNAVNAHLYMELRPDDLCLSPLPLFHSGGLFIAATPTLFRGATLITYKKFDPPKLLKAIEKHRVTVFLAMTTMLNFIIKSENVGDYDLSSLRLLGGGGERTSPEMFGEYAKRGLDLQALFGQTENSIMLFLPAKDTVRKRGSVGVPVFFCDVRICDENGRFVEPGKVGEIVVKGPTVMLGYWNRPDDTARTIVDGWLHTGDLGYYDAEGFFYFVDRMKDMYRSGGENVYPAEVEKILVNHTKIMNVSVIGVPDEKWGETGKALVIPRGGETITLEEIHKYLDGKVARFKFPSRMELVDSFPMTESGKVKKSALKEMYAGCPKSPVGGVAGDRANMV
jgi:fatty-acyl-CoA synthase